MYDPLGEEAPALVLPHDGVAMLEKAGDEWAEEIAHVVRVDEIRDADHHRRHVLPLLSLGKEDHVVQLDAVAHGHHHHVLDVRMAVDVRLGFFGRQRLGGRASGQRQ